MNDEHDVTDRLERLGADPGPTLDPAFADRLDATLRVGHVELRPRRSPRFSRLFPAGLAVAVVIGAVAGAAILARSDSSEVVLTVASNTEVYLADEEATAASPGLVLPDGARIVVGPDGEAVVNGVVLAPGTEALVVGDHIDVVVSVPPDRSPAGSDQPIERPTTSTPQETAPTPSEVRDDSSTTATAATRTDRATSNDAPTSTTGDDPGRGSTPTTARPTTEPPPTRPPSTSASRSTVTSASTASTASTGSSTTDRRPTTSETRPVTSTSKPGEPVITLTASRIDDRRLSLDWVIDKDVVVRGWRVRAGRGDRVATLALIRDGTARTTTIDRAELSGVKIWVEALNGRGRVLARSTAVAIR